MVNPAFIAARITRMFVPGTSIVHHDAPKVCRSVAKANPRNCTAYAGEATTIGPMRPLGHTYAYPVISSSRAKIKPRPCSQKYK